MVSRGWAGFGGCDRKTERACFPYWPNPAFADPVVPWIEVAHLLFIDESGYDKGPSPYGVLGGIAVEDRDVWNLIRAMQEAEIRQFGKRYSSGPGELKAKKLISPQVFRQATLAGPIPPPERATLARECLEHGAGASKRAIAALAQAKLEYVKEVLETCAQFRCRAFASIVDKGSPVPASDHLRKDYAYLFERFFYWRISARTHLALPYLTSWRRSRVIYSSGKWTAISNGRCVDASGRAASCQSRSSSTVT